VIERPLGHGHLKAIVDSDLIGDSERRFDMAARGNDAIDQAA
jgi:hypothetical protein